MSDWLCSAQFYLFLLLLHSLQPTFPLRSVGAWGGIRNNDVLCAYRPIMPCTIHSCCCCCCCCESSARPNNILRKEISDGLEVAFSRLLVKGQRSSLDDFAHEFGFSMVPALPNPGTAQHTSSSLLSFFTSPLFVWTSYVQ